MQHLMGFKGYLREILRVYDVSPKETLKSHLRYILCNALNCKGKVKGNLTRKLHLRCFMQPGPGPEYISTNLDWIIAINNSLKRRL